MLPLLTDWKEKLPKVVHIYSRRRSQESEKVRKGKERNQEENSSSLQRKERMCSVRKMRMRNSGEQTNRQMCVCVCVVTTIVEERERERDEREVSGGLSVHCGQQVTNTGYLCVCFLFMCLHCIFLLSLCRRHWACRPAFRSDAAAAAAADENFVASVFSTEDSPLITRLHNGPRVHVSHVVVKLICIFRCFRCCCRFFFFNGSTRKNCINEAEQQELKSTFIFSKGSLEVICHSNKFKVWNTVLLSSEFHLKKVQAVAGAQCKKTLFSCAIKLNCH